MTTEDDMIGSGWEPVHTDEDWLAFLYANCDDYVKWCAEIQEDKVEPHYEYMAAHDPALPDDRGWKIFRRLLPTGDE